MAGKRRNAWDMSGTDAVLTRGVVLLLGVAYPAVAIVPRLLDGLRGSPLRWVTSLAAPGPDVSGVDRTGITWDLDPTGSVALVLDPRNVAVPLATGMLVLVVAECFRIGVRLRGDVAGLV